MGRSRRRGHCRRGGVKKAVDFLYVRRYVGFPSLSCAMTCHGRSAASAWMRSNAGHRTIFISSCRSMARNTARRTRGSLKKACSCAGSDRTVRRWECRWPSPCPASSVGVVGVAHIFNGNIWLHSFSPTSSCIPQDDVPCSLPQETPARVALV
jgi:hypothetical protein